MRLANKISLATPGLMALSGCNNDGRVPPPAPQNGGALTLLETDPTGRFPEAVALTR